MSETIISALIGAGGAVLVCIITQLFVFKRAKDAILEQREEAFIQQNSAISEIKHEMELIRYMVDELTKHVEKHNQVIDRTYALEKRAEVMEEQIKSINQRLTEFCKLN